MNTFDIDTFNKNKNHLNEYSFNLEPNIFIEQSKLETIYIEYIKKKDSFIHKFNSYHLNGKLKITGSYFDNDFNKGIWKEYDENGNLIEEIDYDKDYDYTWEDLLKLLEERKVNIKDTANTTIRKANGNWRFDYIEDIYIYDVIVDGKTGEILQDAKNIFQEGS